MNQANGMDNCLDPEYLVPGYPGEATSTILVYFIHSFFHPESTSAAFCVIGFLEQPSGLFRRSKIQALLLLDCVTHFFHSS
jgi:hypothetical protein